MSTGNEVKARFEYQPAGACEEAAHHRVGHEADQPAEAEIAEGEEGDAG